MDFGNGKDGFSFRPQREKRPTNMLLQTISPPRPSYQQQQQQHRRQPKQKQHVSRRSHKHRQMPGNTETSKFPLLEYPDFVQVQMEAEEHFNKRFAFTPSPSWTLPPPHTMFTAPHWKRSELQEMKASLNRVKQQLGDKDVAEWHTHTTNTNPCQRVCPALKRRTDPELPTQAWLKFYEIINAYPIVPGDEEEEEEEDQDQEKEEDDKKWKKENGNKKEKEERYQNHHLNGVGDGSGGHINYTLAEVGETVFNSVHLCEAPGAFVASLNHYLALNHPSIKWQWLGSTLNPYYEATPHSQCVNHDRLIYHTLDHWIFGKDNTGDLMKEANMLDVIEWSERLGPVKLVTADGSFDCQGDPSEQESMTHPLHMCEVATALSILATGGSFVIKKFTMFESETLCLIYLLCCAFEHVSVYKPATSKQGNSEVYVVALKYLGKEHIDSHLEKVARVAVSSGVPAKTMFREEDLPRDFLQQVKECSETFMAFQVRSIERNLKLFRAMPEREKQLNEYLKVKATALFFERNYCVPIPKWRMLSHGLANKMRPLLETDWDKVSDSLLMRSHSCAYKFQVLTKLLSKFKEDYVDDGNTLAGGTDYYVSSFTPQPLSKLKLAPVRGRPLDCIEFSKFCSERILRVTKELYNIWEMKQVDYKCDNNGIDSNYHHTTQSNELPHDDSFDTLVLAQYPGATLVRGEESIGLHPGCQALEDVVRMLEDKEDEENKGDGPLKLAIGGSVVIVGAPLLTRLQYGLLLALASAFNRVLVYRSSQVGSSMPVLVLENLKTREAVDEVVKVVQGLSLDGKGNSITRDILQVFGLPALLQDHPLMSVYHYNVHLCAFLAQGILTRISLAGEPE